MWNRVELKERGKAAMKANYGMAVVVSLIMTVLAGGSGAYTGSNVSKNAGDAVKNSGIAPEALVAIMAAVVSIAVIIMIAGFVLKVFLFNPLYVGCRNFFIKNSEAPAQLGEVGRAFQPSWMNNVLTMFLTDLFLGLWFCVFIIPGFVKIYSYRLVPYIMAENPDLKGTEAITLSRQYMKGNKWKAFCFDISFVGWWLLSLITCGILEVLYVGPYYNCACAELYKAIRDENNIVVQE
ncbi:MAG: DUF975 family protein [Lachnospiraceae bacterium]|nr:DUF975 family protein [Lachnospiraceae bacterium]